MPIVRIGTKLVYFAHVPKCAGSAIEEYLAARFGPLGFLDRGHLRLPERQRWNVSSPQHIDAETLDRLLPPSFFAARFAVVRHPVDRLVSVFRYQRDVEETIVKDMPFSEWLDVVPDLLLHAPFHFDNHIRPMTEIVPQNAKIFRLEDGLDPVVEWLDKIAGFIGEPRVIQRTNTYVQRLAVRKKTPGPEIQISDTDRETIKKHYSIDFERFGYLEAVMQ